MWKFVYKNKKTNKKVYSNQKINDKDFVLVNSVRDISIKSNDSKVIKK